MFDLSAERKRKINLGGHSLSSTPASIKERVQAERSARAETKRRGEAVVRIQAWWRGVGAYRGVRDEMRRRVLATGQGGELERMRCLVLLCRPRKGQPNRDEDVLREWVTRTLRDDTVFVGADSPSWTILMRQIALTVLKSSASSSGSGSGSGDTAYLSLLLVLLSSAQSKEITSYLLAHSLYPLLAQAIVAIPLKQSKTSPTLPLLIGVASAPLKTFPPGSSEHPIYLAHIFAWVLSVPLLANRLSLDVLQRFLDALALKRTLSALGATASGDSTLAWVLQTTSTEAKVHLQANLHMILGKHYGAMTKESLEVYLPLGAGLLNRFPGEVFNPGYAAHLAKQGEDAMDVDLDEYDERRTRVDVVSSFEGAVREEKESVLVLDDKTSKRLLAIPGTEHLTSLLQILNAKPSLFGVVVGYLYALSEAVGAGEIPGGPIVATTKKGTAAAAVQPTTKSQILNFILASTGGGLVREVYRGLVRNSPLGRPGSTSSSSSVSDAYIHTEIASVMLDPSNLSHYPPLLFLVEMYSQALLTMGDDEFFSSAANSAAKGPRNPLSLDELVVLSKQLMSMAFVLFWRGEEFVGRVGGQVRGTWEDVRQKVTKWLLSVHARDSRKPFVPRDHWLVTGLDSDMRSFVDAAVLESLARAEEEEEEENERPQSLFGNSAVGPRGPQPGAKYLQSHRAQRLSSAMSPRLGILNNIPFAIPFHVRVQIFREFVAVDADAREGTGIYGSRGMDMLSRGRPERKTRVQVRRGMVAQDGFDKLGDVDLKGGIEISFIDKFGQEEAGIDGGGVFKEFFTSLCNEVFDTDRGLWLATPHQRELYPNPHAYATEQHSLNWYRFVGRVLGKAMWEGILVDVAFAGFFLAKWLGRQSFLDDLASLDRELYNGLVFLKRYEGDFADLAINFTVDSEEFGVTNTIELIPNGANIPVTRENRLEYIHIVAHYKLNKQIKKQSDAFFEGLSEIIDRRWLRMFNQQELQILIGGSPTPISIEDLQAHTLYGGLYSASHPTILMLWRVVAGLKEDDKRALLRFVTSCSRPPLLGFKELVPRFCIRDAGEDEERLPTSSTCVNLLKLPRYKTERSLRSKLLQAIHSGAGFDLS